METLTSLIPSIIILVWVDRSVIHQHKQFCRLSRVDNSAMKACRLASSSGSHKSFFRKTYFLQGSRALTREGSYPEQESLISPSQSLAISTRVFSP